MCVNRSWRVPGYHRQQVISRIESCSMLLRRAVCTAFSGFKGRLLYIDKKYWQMARKEACEWESRAKRPLTPPRFRAAAELGRGCWAQPLNASDSPRRQPPKARLRKSGGLTVSAAKSARKPPVKHVPRQWPAAPASQQSPPHNPAD